MATSYDLNITQGSTFNVRLTTKDSNGNALNLSGYHVSGYIRNKYSDTASLLNMEPLIVSGHALDQTLAPGVLKASTDAIFSGLIDISLIPAKTSALPITQAIYDIEIYLDTAETSVFKILNGKANIHPESTY